MAALEITPRKQPLPHETLLRALESTIPISAALFDAEGRLLWLSLKAERRFRLRPARHRGRSGTAGDLDALDVLRQIALDTLRRPTPVTDRGPRVPDDLLEAHERFAVRRFTEGHGQPPLVLVSVEAKGIAPVSKDTLVEAGLSAREADVALLVGQGCSTINAAARLGIKEGTVKTYLKRVFRKLAVCSRAELSYLLLKPHFDIEEIRS